MYVKWGASFCIGGANIKSSVIRNPKSLEEKVDYLQEQLNEVKRDFDEETKKLTIK